MMAAGYVIGLTGNIASGKSVVARLLAELGADVIDADRVAHTVMAAGTDETREIAALFGESVLSPDRSVDRAALGRIVFSDPDALANLEAIVHPGTRRRIYEQLERSTAPVAVLEAIKLLEGPLVDHVDVVWVVTAPREVRIARLVADRGLTADDAARRIDAQNPEDEKVRRADVVLSNDGTLDDLRGQVERAWGRLPLSGDPVP
jgi:dephospho-CoA kinase